MARGVSKSVQKSVKISATLDSIFVGSAFESELHCAILLRQRSNN